MNNQVFFRLPTDNKMRAQMVRMISKATKGNYWNQCGGNLKAPAGKPNVVANTGYWFSDQAIPELCAKTSDNLINFGSILKGGLPEFINFGDLSTVPGMVEKSDSKEKVSLDEGLEIVSHYVGLGYGGWIELCQHSDFYCSILFQEWTLDENGCYHNMQSVPKQERTGTHPPRIVVQWSQDRRNDYVSSEPDGEITRPIISVLRKLGLEEYEPTPVPA